jgi:Protein of unknown function (DUF998)
LQSQSSHSTRSAGIEHLAILAAVCGLAMFAAIVAVECAINPALDPARHEVSEYVHARLGVLMTVGFACWATSLAATSWAVLTRTGARLVAAGLGVACAGMLVTAVFATQTSAGRLPPGETLTPIGRLHDIGSGTTTVALLFAALLSLRSLKGQRFRRQVALLLIVLLCSDIVLLAVGPQVAGVRQRILLAGASVWQLLTLHVAAAADSGANTTRQ